MGFPLLVVLLLIVGVFYAVFDPETTRWMPKCPVHTLTGWDCPGCGSQRAIHALLRGDFAAAFGHNAFLLLLSPYLLLLAAAEIWRRRLPRLHRMLTSSVAVYILLGLIAFWTLYRNLF